MCVRKYVIDILLKTCFRRFIRADKSWKGLLAPVHTLCQVKSYLTHAHANAHTAQFSTVNARIESFPVRPNWK